MSVHDVPKAVILAHDSRFGGHALYIKDGTLTDAYNFLGIPPETRISAPAPASGRHLIGLEFTRNAWGSTTSRTGLASSTSAIKSSPRPS